MTARRVLEPHERISEVLFGLIMVLTFTGSLSVAEAGREDVRTMLIGALGCNLAWGIIDAVFYLMGSRFNRNRRVRLVRRLKAAHSDDQAIALIREEFNLEGEPPSRAEDRAAFHRALLQLLRHAGSERAHFRRQEFAATAIILGLVSLCVNHAHLGRITRAVGIDGDQRIIAKASLALRHARRG